MCTIDREIFEFVEKNTNFQKISPSNGKLLDIEKKDFIKVAKKLFFFNKKFRKLVFEKIADTIETEYND